MSTRVFFSQELFTNSSLTHFFALNLTPLEPSLLSQKIPFIKIGFVLLYLKVRDPVKFRVVFFITVRI